MLWPKTPHQQALVDRADVLADRFEARALAHDRAGTFPHENFADLHRDGLLALTIPRAFGGGGATLLEAVLAQERLARGDGSTALGVAMHLSIMGRLGAAIVAGDTGEMGGWTRERYAAVARTVVEEGALINSAASEPETGSPSRGGRPATTAVPDGAAGVGVNGPKTYTTKAPALRLILVSATVELPSGAAAGQFLIEADWPGVEIEETWDSVGMRATGSHDLVLREVRVPSSALLTSRPYHAPDETAKAQTVARGGGQWESPGGPAATLVGSVVEPSAVPPAPPDQRPVSGGAGWALLVPAVYLGIATAARDAAVTFARDRRPQPLGGRAIGELPAIQRLLGEIEIALAEARGVLFGTAEAWDELPARRSEAVPLLAAAKYVATNRAVEITDKALRVVGGAGLSRAHPLQRYYRDVRAGLHHPPMDDVALATLARAALG
jgi:alkylation response protein AidB-like acyl-CoA dehydrogenase